MAKDKVMLRPIPATSHRSSADQGEGLPGHLDDSARPDDIARLHEVHALVGTEPGGNEIPANVRRLFIGLAIFLVAIRAEPAPWPTGSAL